MRLSRIIISELILLLASILVFRSIWHMMDQYLGDAYLPILLVVGLVLATLALIWLNKEAKSQ